MKNKNKYPNGGSHKKSAMLNYSERMANKYRYEAEDFSSKSDNTQTPSLSREQLYIPGQFEGNYSPSFWNSSENPLTPNYGAGGDFLAGALGGLAGSIPFVGGAAKGLIGNVAEGMGADIESSAASIGSAAGGIGAMAINPAAGFGSLLTGSPALNTNIFKNGGQANVDFEAEKGEVILGDINVNPSYNGGYATKFGDTSVYKLGGSTHSQGGIGINAKGTARIYSNSKELKVPKMFGKGGTFADAATFMGRELADIIKMESGDVYDRNTAKRNKPKVMDKFEGLYQAQESFKKVNGFSNSTRMAEKGGEVKFGELLGGLEYGQISGGLPGTSEVQSILGVEDISEEQYVDYMMENYPDWKNNINTVEETGAYMRANPDPTNPYGWYKDTKGNRKETDAPANLNYKDFGRNTAVDIEAFKTGIMGPEVGGAEKDYSLPNAGGSSAYGPYQILYSQHKDKLKKLYGVEDEAELAYGTIGRLGVDGMSAEDIQEAYMDEISSGYEKKSDAIYDKMIKGNPNFFNDTGISKSDLMAMMHFKGATGAEDYLDSVNTSMYAGTPYNPLRTGDEYEENPGAPIDTTKTGEFIYPEGKNRNMLTGDYMRRFGDSYAKNAQTNAADVEAERRAAFQKEKDANVPIKSLPRIPASPIPTNTPPQELDRGPSFSIPPLGGGAGGFDVPLNMFPPTPTDNTPITVPNIGMQPPQGGGMETQGLPPRGAAPSTGGRFNSPLDIHEMHAQLGLGTVPTNPNVSGMTSSPINPGGSQVNLTGQPGSQPAAQTAGVPPNWNNPAQPNTGNMGPINGDLVGGYQPPMTGPVNQPNWSNPPQWGNPTGVTGQTGPVPSPLNPPSNGQPASTAPVSGGEDQPFFNLSGVVNPNWTRVMQNRMGITTNPDGSSVSTTDPLRAVGNPKVQEQGDTAGLPWQLYAANAIPGLMNIGKGLFGEAPTMELDRMKEQEYQDFNPIMNAYSSGQGRALALGRAGLQGSGATGAQLRGGYQAMSSNSQANAGQFYNQLAPKMQQSRMETDRYNQGIAQQNQQMGLMEDQFALQNNPMNSFVTGAEQLVSAGTNLYMDNLKTQNMGTQMYDWRGNFTGGNNGKDS
jgi:hypothetical protein